MYSTYSTRCNDVSTMGWARRHSTSPMTPPAVETGGYLLLVDPHGYQQFELLQALAAAGWVVYTVGSVTEAWACLTGRSPQLILLEASLPASSSFNFCQQLQQGPETQHIPVLFWGQGQEPGDRLQAFAVGGADYIPKPYWPEEVVARIKLQVARRETQQRLQTRTQQMLANHSPSPLLANLQRTLHQQTVRLKEQNARLQQEIDERQEAELALRHEQQKSEKLLLNILPEAVVEQLKQFQGSLAERFDDATVLFADIVNFTPLAAQYSPLELVNLLNQIFSAFDRLAERYHLEKIKTIGDAYMVVGGVPVSRPGHAAAVADMALAMHQVISEFSRDDRMPLQLRIGINTGSVVAGVIGIKKFSYDLWGDTVNVASRMESQGQPEKIQVTETTYARLADRFEFQPGPEIAIKGKGPMKTYYLIGRL